MLEFDSNHQSLDISLKKAEQKLNIKNLILSGMLISSIFLFSGCAKKVDCDISDLHAHTYINNESMYTYMVSEKEHTMNGWHRTDDFIILDKDMEELINYQNKNGLLKISQNQDTINQIVSRQEDYVEYRYKYRTLHRIPNVRRINGHTSITYTLIPMNAYSWTTNSNEEGLTGEKRVVQYVYIGYKIQKNENGKFKIIESEPVDSLNELPPGFDYIKKDFYKKVLKDNKTLEPDYEEVYEDDVIEDGKSK